MKKYLSLLTIVFIFLFATKTYATTLENSIDASMLKTDEIDTLTKTENFSFTALFEKVLTNEISLNPVSILNEIIKMVFSEIFLNISLIRNLILICVLSSFFTVISDSFKNKEASKLAFYTCFLAIITILYNSFYLAYEISITLIDYIYNFVIVSLPLISGSILISGNPSFLVGFNPVIFFFTEVVIIIIKTILFPFILCISSLEIINNLTDKDILSTFSKTGRQVISWALKGLSGLFISVISVIRITAPIADNLLNKSAKVGISIVPVVGSSLSNALDTALFLGKSIKNGAMVSLLIALVIYISVYFIKLFSFVIIYKVTAIAIEPIADKKICKTINIVSDYVGYLISCCFFASMMFVFAVLMIISL